MELPERGGQAHERRREAGITAEGVSFRYPNAQEDSVSGINLQIKFGETVAIVGENGAGKTTLARLLTGIYKPTEGKVILYGMDTSDTDAQHLFGNMSGVFQKYQRYQMTLRDNIRISDFKGAADIEPSLLQAGVSLDSGSFPNGTETMLSREFEGVDLSGGECQRVAIARGLYRIHDTILLDEPTAAIDPGRKPHLSAIYQNVQRQDFNYHNAPFRFYADSRPCTGNGQGADCRRRHA
jgi:ATP-binding cassette subfamily B protein